MTRLAHIDARPEQTLAHIEPAVILEAVAAKGAVLLRGFDCDAAGFERFTTLFCERFHASPARANLPGESSDGTTTRAPEVNFSLLAHNEASYRPFEPPHLAFFLCLEAPSRPGGETLLVDGRAFLARMPEALMKRFLDEGVIFESRWAPARWQAELGVADPASLAELESKIAGLELSLDGEMLIYRCRRTAIQADGQGVPVFANAILAHLPEVRHPAYRDAKPYGKPGNQVYFGDGEPLSDAVVNTLVDIQDETGYAHRLRRNDLLVIDNSRVMHGRRFMEGDCPRVLLTRFGYLRGR